MLQKLWMPAKSRALVSAVLIGVCLREPALSQEPKTVWSGVYSREQARRGEELYAQECASCHGPRLQGFGASPPLVGIEFAVNWEGHTLAELYDRIRVSMPGNDPGKLTPQQNADLVAFILRTANFPYGQIELSREPETLEQIVFKTAR